MIYSRNFTSPTYISAYLTAREQGLTLEKKNVLNNMKKIAWEKYDRCINVFFSETFYIKF